MILEISFLNRFSVFRESSEMRYQIESGSAICLNTHSIVNDKLSVALKFKLLFSLLEYLRDDGTMRIVHTDLNTKEYNVNCMHRNQRFYRSE